jgi:hypothetical protein
MLAKSRLPVTDPLGAHLDYLRIADDPGIDPVHIEPDLTQVTASENSTYPALPHPNKLPWGNSRCELPNYSNHSRCNGSRTAEQPVF